MKNRNGFVSNSSSSSFVVSLSNLTDEDAMKIMEYDNHCNGDKYSDGWTLDMNKYADTISGWTPMDNGDLSDYLGPTLANKLEWDHF